MTLNLQSKPDLLSSQAVLLLSMSQIWQIGNYLQFSIWGCRAHTTPPNKLSEQTDRVCKALRRPSWSDSLTLSAFKVKSVSHPAPVGWCQQPGSISHPGALQGLPSTACPSDKHQQPELTSLQPGISCYTAWATARGWRDRHTEGFS